MAYFYFHLDVFCLSGKYFLIIQESGLAFMHSFAVTILVVFRRSIPVLIYSGVIDKLTYELVIFDLLIWVGLEQSIDLTRTGIWDSQTCSGFIYRTILFGFKPTA